MTDFAIGFAAGRTQQHVSQEYFTTVDPGATLAHVYLGKGFVGVPDIDNGITKAFEAAGLSISFSSEEVYGKRYYYTVTCSVVLPDGTIVAGKKEVHATKSNHMYVYIAMDYSYMSIVYNYDLVFLAVKTKHGYIVNKKIEITELRFNRYAQPVDLIPLYGYSMDYSAVYRLPHLYQVTGQDLHLQNNEPKEIMKHHHICLDAVDKILFRIS